MLQKKIIYCSLETFLYSQEHKNDHNGQWRTLKTISSGLRMLAWKSFCGSYETPLFISSVKHAKDKSVYLYVDFGHRTICKKTTIDSLCACDVSVRC